VPDKQYIGYSKKATLKQIITTLKHRASKEPTIPYKDLITTDEHLIKMDILEEVENPCPPFELSNIKRKWEKKIYGNNNKNYIEVEVKPIPPVEDIPVIDKSLPSEPVKKTNIELLKLLAEYERQQAILLVNIKHTHFLINLDE
jgi:hypothetical protein